jgi:xanthine permease XanP
MAKPVNLIYGVDDRPPLPTTLILGLQQIFITFIGLIFPVVIVQQMGTSITGHDANAFVSLSLMTGGVITILQAFRLKGFGSGYLCPAICGPAYLNASLQAAVAGGLPLMFGMTAFVGVIEALFSRLMHRLRTLFPPEVTGTVVALVGIVVIPLSVRNLVGIGFNDTVSETREVLVGVIALLIMIGFNVFPKGKLRLYSTIIGMILGYLLSIAFGILDRASFEQVRHASFFSVPYISHLHWSIDFRLIVPFTIAALSSTLKTIGDLSTCQRINDSNWKRVDMKSVTGGILVDGLGGVIPGMVGGYGQSTSSSNIGLSVATGATSRTIAYSAGGLLILLAFFPQLAGIFIIMPKPVMGAVMIFSISFMIVQGFQMIMSRMLDARKIFVVGISLILGLSVDMVPGLYQNLHPWIQPIFSSSLSLGAVSAVVLNLLLRIGVRKEAVLALDPEQPGTDVIFTFLEKQGQLWGARRESITQSSFAISEAFELISDGKLSEGPVRVLVAYDEFNLRITLDYKGKPFATGQALPDAAEIEAHPENTAQLAGFLLSHYCSRIRISESEGSVKIRMVIEN